MERKCCVPRLAEDLRKVEFVSLARLDEQADGETEVTQDPRRQADGGDRGEEGRDGGEAAFDFVYNGAP